MAQGDQATSAYFVLYGNFTVWVLFPDGDEPVQVGSCERGNVVGELAILGVDGGARSATVKARSPTCAVWKLERQDLLNVLSKHQNQKRIFEDIIRLRSGMNKAQQEKRIRQKTVVMESFQGEVNPKNRMRKLVVKLRHHDAARAMKQKGLLDTIEKTLKEQAFSGRQSVANVALRLLDTS